MDLQDESKQVLFLLSSLLTRTADAIRQSLGATAIIIVAETACGRAMGASGWKDSPVQTIQCVVKALQEQAAEAGAYSAMAHTEEEPS